MNTTIEDLRAERQAAYHAVEHFQPVTQAWAFEVAPASPKRLLASYLDEVRACDSFLLIVGEHVTPPVEEEVQVARDYGKPMLVFCKEVATRDAEAVRLLRSVDCKYEGFAKAEDLQEKARRAIGAYILTLTQKDGSEGNELGDRLARLRRFQRSRRPLRLLPCVPRHEHNSYVVEEVSATTVRFRKNGIADVYVPANRIEDILETGEHEPATAYVNGRLQWITVRRNWYFFPERPPADDLLCIGHGREIPNEVVLSDETQSWLKAYPLTFRWSTLGNVAARQVFFEVDGCHLTNRGRILTCG